MLLFGSAEYLMEMFVHQPFFYAKEKPILNKFDFNQMIFATIISVQS